MSKCRTLHIYIIQCDAAALVHDKSNPKSFEYIARIYIKYFAESKMPVLIIANKSNLSEVKQEYLLQPQSFCSKYKLMQPQPYSISRTVRREIFVKLATMAAFPHMNQFGLMQGDWIVWWKAGIGIAVATFAGFIFMRILSTDKR